MARQKLNVSASDVADDIYSYLSEPGMVEGYFDAFAETGEEVSTGSVRRGRGARVTLKVGGREFRIVVEEIDRLPRSKDRCELNRHGLPRPPRKRR